MGKERPGAPRKCSRSRVRRGSGRGKEIGSEDGVGGEMDPVGLYEGWCIEDDEWCMIEEGEEEWEDMDLVAPLPDIILGRVPKTDPAVDPEWMALLRLEGRRVDEGDPLGLRREEEIRRLRSLTPLQERDNDDYSRGGGDDKGARSV